MDKTTENTTTALATIDTEQLTLIIGGAPEILDSNRASVDRAKSAATALLDTIEGQGMSAELDAECNALLVKLKKTTEFINTKRTPVTQFANFIIKSFTTLENEIDPKTKDGVYARIQAKRDEFAAANAKAQREKEQAAARKLELDKELIRLKSEVQTQLVTFFGNYSSNRIGKVLDLYNAITLDNFDRQKAAVNEFSNTYSHEHYESFAPSIRPIYASTLQVQELTIEATKGKYGEFVDQYRTAIDGIKQQVLDKLPSRKAELEAIEKEKKLNSEKAALMEKQAADRAAEDERKRKEQEALSLQAAESKIATTAQAETTQSLFDAQVTISEAPQQAASIRESYEIEVTNSLGYLLIVQFYFEHEGKSEKVESLSKKTLGAMKKFCESYAMKHGEKINSPFVIYNEKFKALAKKATA